MVRALAAALLLAAFAAGCGGTTTSKAALQVARESGGADPSVARIERVRDASGDAVDVVLVRAHYCAAGGNGASTPSPGGGCGPNYAWFSISPDTHKLAGISTFLAHGAVQAVAGARRSVPVLRTFSAIPGLLARCKIHRAGSRRAPIAGLCQSNDLGTLRNGDRRVEFLEHWPLSEPHGSRHSGGWIVILDGNGQVLGVHTTGRTPPQLSR
jgi:hypothetical protein